MPPPTKQRWQWGNVGLYITCYNRGKGETYLIMNRRKRGMWATPGGGCAYPIARQKMCINEDLAFRLSALKELQEGAGVSLTTLGFEDGAPLVSGFGAGCAGAEVAAGGRVTPGLGAGSAGAEPSGDGVVPMDVDAGDAGVDDAQRAANRLALNEVWKACGLESGRDYEEACALMPVEADPHTFEDGSGRINRNYWWHFAANEFPLVPGPRGSHTNEFSTLDDIQNGDERTFSKYYAWVPLKCINTSDFGQRSLYWPCKPPIEDIKARLEVRDVENGFPMQSGSYRNSIQSIRKTIVEAL